MSDMVQWYVEQITQHPFVFAGMVAGVVIWTISVIAIGGSIPPPRR